MCKWERGGDDLRYEILRSGKILMTYAETAAKGRWHGIACIDRLHLKEDGWFGHKARRVKQDGGGGEGRRNLLGQERLHRQIDR